MTAIATRFCSICLDIKSEDVFKYLPCLHWFCRTCLGKLVQNVCPLCRSPFEPEPSFSNPINIDILSRSAPSVGVTQRQPDRSPILSRSADSTTRDFETLATFTGIQNVNSLAQVLTELEVKEQTQFRRRRRRKRRRLPAPDPPDPILPPIFQFDSDSDSDGDGDGEAKSENTLDKNSYSKPTSRKSPRGDRWAHLNRQRSNRRGR